MLKFEPLTDFLKSQCCSSSKISFLLLTVIIVLLSNQCQGYTASKISTHFSQLDLNHNAQIQLQEYTKSLKQEDVKNGIQEDDSYYLELVQLLYDQYDTNQDLAIDLDEWVGFAKDIFDETSGEAFLLYNKTQNHAGKQTGKSLDGEEVSGQYPHSEQAQQGATIQTAQDKQQQTKQEF